jgi:hypothetical protein
MTTNATGPATSSALLPLVLQDAGRTPDGNVAPGGNPETVQPPPHVVTEAAWTEPL